MTKTVPSISRDISITLTIKFILLFALWWINFSHVHKPVVDVKQWMLTMSETHDAPKP